MNAPARIVAPAVAAPRASLAEAGHAEPTVRVPDYLVDTYRWAYLDPANAELLDHRLVVSAILWGNYRRLVEAACSQFQPGEHVLQAASVYGDQPLRLADTLGPAGRLEVIDVSALQIARLREKFAGRTNAFARVADAASPGAGSYDGVLSFFLLHEMPDDYKRLVVDALLARVRPGGRAVFVDYARPRWFHPLGGLMALVNRWLEPYAHSLWRRPIESFATHGTGFSWHERRLFLGLYQIVVAERR